MNKEWKDKWVEALRSGEYKQGQGSLFEHDNGGEYCCLGVLAEIMGELIKEPDMYGQVLTPEGNKSCGFLSNRQLDMVSLGREQQYILSKMNDDILAKSFNEIADYIEANL